MYINDFITYLDLEKKYSEHTITAYRADLNAFLTFLEQEYEEVNIMTANYAQIRSWIVVLVNTGISTRTINRKIASLKSYYKFLLKIGDIDQNPLRKHKALKTSKPLQIPFSTLEMDKVMLILNAGNDFKSVRDRLIVELLYATGIRRIELIQLKVQDVDFHQAQIKVLGKRNKERYVPLLKGITKTLKRYLELRLDCIEELHQEALFVTEKGIKIYETLVYRVVNSYFSRASTKAKTSPHILRHTFATHLLNEGANINAVKELLGHSSLAATEVYTHHNIAQLSKVYKKAHPRNK